MSNTVLPHIWTSPGSFIHLRLLSWILGRSTRAKRLSKLGHWKYGLQYQDLVVNTPVVQQAVDRLPLKEQELRKRRVKRACVLFSAKSELPKDQWTKPEEDIEYLTPYILDILEEKHDRNTWKM